MLKQLFGDPNARKLKKYQPIVTEIALLEEEMQQLSDEQLKGKTTEFKRRLEQANNDEEEKELLDEILPEALDRKSVV